MPLGNPPPLKPSSFLFAPDSCPLLGYSVSSMFLRGGRRLFLSGAPRFRHRGKVIAFQLKKDGAVRVAQSLQGEQVGHPRAGGTLGSEGNSACGGREQRRTRGSVLSLVGRVCQGHEGQIDRPATASHLSTITTPFLWGPRAPLLPRLAHTLAVSSAHWTQTGMGQRMFYSWLPPCSWDPRTRRQDVCMCIWWAR